MRTLRAEDPLSATSAGSSRKAGDASCCFTATQLRKAGYSAAELAGAGFSVAALQRAGFDVDALRELCAGDDKQLRRLQEPPSVAIRSVGLTYPRLLKMGFSVETAVKLRAKKCSAGELKKAGFAPEVLQKAGYEKRELGNAGWNATDLAGIPSPRDRD